MSDEAQVAAFFGAVGEFDHLTTPGSVVVGGPFLSTDAAQARAEFDSKFWGQYYAAKWGAPRIRPGGSIVLFSGMYAHRPPPGAASVAAINGAIIGIGAGVVIYFWKGVLVIALATMLAMLLNFLVAAFAGVLVPLGLKLIRVDPALASAAFVTAVTDTLGFLFFLGIATLLMQWL